MTTTIFTKNPLLFYRGKILTLFANVHFFHNASLLNSTAMMNQNKACENAITGEINLQGLKLRFNPLETPDLTVTFDEFATIQEKYNCINKLIEEVNSFSYKGFLDKHNLEAFPIINEILPFFTNHKDATQSEAYISGSRVDESFKWIINIFYLSLLNECYKILKDLDPKSDLAADFEELSKNLYSRLETSIRSQLQKSGISIIKNVYTGFDTEYKNIDTETNQLLSVQIATTSKVIIKLPKQNMYDLSGINTLSNIKYRYNLNLSSVKFDYERVQLIINDLIAQIRILKFGFYDSMINILTEGLKESPLKFMETETYTLFATEKSPISTFIYLTPENGKGYGITDLIKQSNLMAEPFLRKSELDLFNKLKLIYKWNETSNEVKSNVNKYIGDDEINRTSEEFLMDCKRDFLEKLSDGGTKESQVEPVEILIESEDELELIKYQSGNKRLSRTYMSSFTDFRVSVSKINNNFLIGHLTPADLGIMNDFDKFKEELSIVKKSFVTLHKPIVHADTNVIIRDTMLLAPGPSKSLGAISNLYPNIKKKLMLSKFEIENMDLLLKNDKDKFVEYAVNDAVITLIHGVTMEESAWGLNYFGVPITLSSLAKANIKHHWAKSNYKGYQLEFEYLIGDASLIQTPKGLRAFGDIGHKLSLYIGNYKGGRNECYMYGVDENTNWIDYDLISAYTTVLSIAGNPMYGSGCSLNVDELKDLSDEELIYNYIIIKCKFRFPKQTKFPSIPCYVDETTTIYPLNGEAILTGAEYILARNQNCKLDIFEIFTIPFEKADEKAEKSTQKAEKFQNLKEVEFVKSQQKVENLKEYVVNVKNVIVSSPLPPFLNLPFRGVISDLQKKRREHQKGTFLNALYKELGNSIYGLVVRGMGNRMNYDIQTGRTLRMEASDVTNPIIASWTTAFVRSVIGELLHFIAELNGLVVSVTTDGFITNISDLEEKCNTPLFTQYKRLRYSLSKDDKGVGLEIKAVGKGIVSWTTRGQLGINSTIKSTTGFQTFGYTKEDLIGLFKETLDTKHKSFTFANSSLRSAKTIYKNGGHVTMLHRDQIFRLQFDNRRRLVGYDESDCLNFSGKILDSEPLFDITECQNLRGLMKFTKHKAFNKFSSNSNNKVYKNALDKAVRTFIKGLLSQPSKYNLVYDFENYSELIDFLKKFNPKIKATKTGISSLKNRNMIFHSVPQTPETLKFVDYLKIKYPNFDTVNFFQS